QERRNGGRRRDRAADFRAAAQPLRRSGADSKTLAPGRRTRGGGAITRAARVLQPRGSPGRITGYPLALALRDSIAALAQQNLRRDIRAQRAEAPVRTDWTGS